jgi:hypothetical protein
MKPLLTSAMIPKTAEITDGKRGAPEQNPGRFRAKSFRHGRRVSGYRESWMLFYRQNSGVLALVISMQIVPK